MNKPYPFLVDFINLFQSDVDNDRHDGFFFIQFPHRQENSICIAIPAQHTVP